MASSSVARSLLYYGTDMIKQTIQSQRDFFRSGATLAPRFRIEALKKLRGAIVENRALIEQALHSDLSKSRFESYTTEIGILLSEIDYHLKHLKSWMKPRKAKTPLFLMPATSKVICQPLGTVLIVSPWNYPVQLSLNPLIGAVSAGNCAVVKLSPSAAASAGVIEKIISETFPEHYICALQGGKEVMNELLEERFDHIFYTGGSAFGKTVMQAASRNLTPVTLELGGKSPCIVDKDADINIAARRIGWGKFLNAGQTCVAPDYILIHKSVKTKFEAALQEAVARFFGPKPEESPDYPRIIDAESVIRLAGLLDGAGKIIFGGTYDADSRFFSPTAIEITDTECQLMKQEIFGPLLPIIEYEDLQQACDFISEREKPLALYYFGNKQAASKVLACTSSGGACVNDTVMHLANRHLPFGGVGYSGMGRYHGRDSFDTFSNRRAVLSTSTLIDVPARYAPYKWLRIIERLL